MSRLAWVVLFQFIFFLGEGGKKRVNKNLPLLGLHHLLRDLPLPCSSIAAALIFLAGGIFPWGCVLVGVWCPLGGVGDQLEAGSRQDQCCPSHRGVGACTAPHGHGHLEGSPAPSPLPDGPAVCAQLCSQQRCCEPRVPRPLIFKT